MKKRIAYITDIHLDEDFPIKQNVDARKNWQLILNDVKSRGINDVVFGGDIGENDANKWFFDSLKEFKLDITLGNHDEFSNMIKYYKPVDYLQKEALYYAYEEGLFKYVFMDSSPGIINDTQLEWFKSALKTTKNIIVFIHHPIIPVATIMDKKYYLLERAKIKNELLNLKSKVVVFCGHYHMVDDLIYENIHQILSPAASYQVEKLSDQIKINTETFGYRIIEIEDEKIKTKLVLYKNNRFIDE